MAWVLASTLSFTKFCFSPSDLPESYIFVSNFSHACCMYCIHYLSCLYQSRNAINEFYALAVKFSNFFVLFYVCSVSTCSSELYQLVSQHIKPKISLVFFFALQIILLVTHTYARCQWVPNTICRYKGPFMLQSVLIPRPSPINFMRR